MGSGGNQATCFRQLRDVSGMVGDERGEAGQVAEGGSSKQQEG